jgi:hypothetical protein
MAAQPISRLPLSKFAFCDLVLDTALELEKARLGGQLSSAPIERLAEALSDAVKEDQPAGRPVFLEPAYFDSFERLFRVQRGNPESVEQIQAFLREAVDDLRDLEHNTGATEKLGKVSEFCLVLHQELAREIEAEESGVTDDWRTSDISVAARFF